MAPHLVIFRTSARRASGVTTRSFSSPFTTQPSMVVFFGAWSLKSQFQYFGRRVEHNRRRRVRERRCCKSCGYNKYSRFHCLSFQSNTNNHHEPLGLLSLSMFKEEHCRGMLRQLPGEAVGVFGHRLFRRDLRNLPRPARQRDLVVARLARVEHEPRGVCRKDDV